VFSLSAAPAPATPGFSSRFPRLGWRTPARPRGTGEDPARPCQGMAAVVGAVGQQQVRPKEPTGKGATEQGLAIYKSGCDRVSSCQSGAARGFSRTLQGHPGAGESQAPAPVTQQVPGGPAGPQHPRSFRRWAERGLSHGASL